MTQSALTISTQINNYVFNCRVHGYKNPLSLDFVNGIPPFLLNIAGMSLCELVYFRVRLGCCAMCSCWGVLTKNFNGSTTFKVFTQILNMQY